MTITLHKNLHAQYLKAMGIEIWVRRNISSKLTEEVSMPAPPSPPEALPQNPKNKPEASPVQLLNWEELKNRVTACTACELHKSRTQTVFGVGNRQADLILIGEAPGADEDIQGEPFVGRAGQLLNAMIYSIGLKREDLYIINIVKCRPPGNRNPHIDEMACCKGFLQRQIALIKPKLIVALGRVAAHHLLVTDTAIGKLRGQRFEYGDAKIPLIATYHPAYLLRRPSEKRHAWQDLQFIQQTLSSNYET